MKSRLNPWVPAIVLAVIAHAALLRLPLSNQPAQPAAGGTLAVTLNTAIDSSASSETNAEQPKPTNAKTEKPDNTLDNTRDQMAPGTPDQPLMTKPTSVTRPQKAASVAPQAPAKAIPVPPRRAPPTSPNDAPATDIVQPDATGEPALAAPNARETAAEDARRELKADYEVSLQAHLARHLQYPMMARHRRQEGNVVVALTVDHTGTVTTVRLAQESPFPLLNREVLALIRRASPLPPLPPALEATAGEWEVPVTFSLE